MSQIRDFWNQMVDAPSETSEEEPQVSEPPPASEEPNYTEPDVSEEPGETPAEPPGCDEPSDQSAEPEICEPTDEAPAEEAPAEETPADEPTEEPPTEEPPIGAAIWESITISPPNPTIAGDGQQQFTATGTYSDGYAEDITGVVEWSSSAPDVVSIDSSGSAVAAPVSGTATITATDPDSGVSGSTEVTVGDEVSPDAEQPGEAEADEDTEATLDERLASSGWDGRFERITQEEQELANFAHDVDMIAKTERGKPVDALAGQFVNDVYDIGTARRELGSARRAAAEGNQLEAEPELESQLSELERRVIQAQTDLELFKDEVAAYRANCGVDKEAAAAARVIRNVCAQAHADAQLQEQQVWSLKQELEGVRDAVENQETITLVNAAINGLSILLNAEPTGVLGAGLDLMTGTMSFIEKGPSADTAVNAVGILSNFAGKIGGPLGLASDVTGTVLQLKEDADKLHRLRDKVSTIAGELAAALGALAAAMTTFMNKLHEAEGLVARVNKHCDKQRDKVEQF